MLHRAKSTAIRLWKDENGATLLEYALLVGIIVAVSVTLVTAVGVWGKGQFSALCVALGKNADTCQ
jgi:Flp pilus assembly pilin Flp